MTKKCQFRKKNGQRCGANTQIGRETCVFHDPAKAEDGRRARRAGGITRSRLAAVLPRHTPDHPLARATDVSMLLADSINQLRRGELDARVANAIGYLASVQLRSFEQGMIEDRLAKVEERLGLVSIPLIANHDQAL
jgi:hypothetical protein